RNPLLRFSTVTDFLNMDDVRFVGACLEESLLRDRMERILRRDLLKRALHISRRSVIGKPTKRADGTETNTLDELLTLVDEPPAALRELREIIFEDMPAAYRQDTEIYDLWVDLPSGPSLSGEASRCDVVFGKQPDVPPEKLNKLFPLDRWLESYEQNKWSG